MNYLSTTMQSAFNMFNLHSIMTKYLLVFPLDRSLVLLHSFSLSLNFLF